MPSSPFIKAGGTFSLPSRVLHDEEEGSKVDSGRTVIAADVVAASNGHIIHHHLQVVARQQHLAIHTHDQGHSITCRDDEVELVRRQLVRVAASGVKDIQTDTCRENHGCRKDKMFHP
jgi:hypothetical protein